MEQLLQGQWAGQPPGGTAGDSVLKPVLEPWGCSWQVLAVRRAGTGRGPPQSTAGCSEGLELGGGGAWVVGVGWGCDGSGTLTLCGWPFCSVPPLPASPGWTSLPPVLGASELASDGFLPWALLSL